MLGHVVHPTHLRSLLQALPDLEPRISKHGARWVGRQLSWEEQRAGGRRGRAGLGACGSQLTKISFAGGTNAHNGIQLSCPACHQPKHHQVNIIGRWSRAPSITRVTRRPLESTLLAVKMASPSPAWEAIY